MRAEMAAITNEEVNESESENVLVSVMKEKPSVSENLRAQANENENESEIGKLWSALCSSSSSSKRLKRSHPLKSCNPKKKKIRK